MCGQVLDLDLLTEPEVQDLFPHVRDRAAIVRGLRRAGVIIGVPSQGQRVYPAFQFLGARPHPIVAAVNLLLRADHDAWAAATWWIRHHEALGDRPLTLLNRVGEQDRLLVAATLSHSR